MIQKLNFIRLFLFLIFILSIHSKLFATVDGAISGTVLDDKGIAVPNAKVVIKGQGAEKDLTSSATGTFQAFPLTIGDYEVDVTADGFSPYQGSVAVSGSNTSLDIRLSAGGEMQMKVSAKRNLVTPASDSSRDLSKDDIEQLPGGGTTDVRRLLYTTTAGFVEGALGQVFTRGNHANLQYQIDGIQLPDSVGGSFGEAFTPSNIDHMEILTGGLQPEYGNRLAGVVNIVTKSGSTEPGGEIGTSYGSYNQTESFANYGGSDTSGALHYFLSLNAFSTDRGLDTPAPADINNDQNGGSENVTHDKSYGSDEFLKLDWVADNFNKFDLVAYNETKFNQIPTYDSSFDPGGPNFAYFNGSTDGYGNGPFNYVPSTTNDTQSEANKYVELAWKHTFDENSFIQIAPYWKESNLVFANDLANDLAFAQDNSLAGQIGSITESSYSQNRTSDNYGTQVDYTLHADANNLIKIGGQVLLTQSYGPVSVVEAVNTGNGPTTAASGDSSTDTGYEEGVYVQDELTLAKWLVLSGGIRFDSTQYVFPGTTAYDSNWGPRIGLSILPTETTKFHVFYGNLFMPAPPEDLKDTFVNLGQGNQLVPYNIKAEKDNYFEAGLDQQLGTQLVTLNAYYKDATNMLDETQLLNTGIDQPYNFATGYAYGVEFSTRGTIDKDWSDFANYSYEIAKGQGISGGDFAFTNANLPAAGVYQFLDHCQINTANVGLTYNPGDLWITAEGLYGGGLSTGPGNSLRLPDHLTMDTTIGYAFKKGSGLSGLKASLDVLNVFDDSYVIFINNGYNGNHYESGREFIFHLAEAI
jgi:outer membrane cobalamin receptor